MIVSFASILQRMKDFVVCSGASIDIDAVYLEMNYDAIERGDA